MNSFSETKYYGAQTFYPPNCADSMKLAMCIQDSLRDNADKNNKRRPHEKGPIVILTNLKTPTVIVECGFLSNPEEEKKLNTDEYQTIIAKAIKSGIDNYFN